MADDPMWSIVMFDLPVLTAKQRREASRFRHLLLDEGFWMAQYSVYVRYSPTMSGEVRRIRAIKAALPDGGEVRVLYVTDREWSTMLCFREEAPLAPDPAPQQLTIF
jgi:CRISPR-associated endoribonuclease cas2|nr:CRISPR-associated endonuclease Cas2 [uncultured Actinomyces sp.]